MTRIFNLYHETYLFIPIYHKEQKKTTKDKYYASV